LDTTKDSRVSRLAARSAKDCLMSNLVLVHGAWHGAWCWARVLPGLRRRGHRVFAVTLTGVGERAHLLRPDITLQTHIDDVAMLIEAEELRDVVLVGHSYAGIMITGVADRMPQRLKHLVYVDAVIAHPGESWSSTHPAAVQAQRRAAIAVHGFIPAASASTYGLTGDDAQWVERRQTPHPGKVYDEPLHFDAARMLALPRTFLACTDPALPTIAVARTRARTEPGWRVVELATGHDPMISAPDEFEAAVLAAAT